MKKIKVMKVICIDAGPNKQGVIPEEIKEGKDYIVIYESESGENYCLSGCLYSYSKKRFIPISDIDETELVNQKQETY